MAIVVIQPSLDELIAVWQPAGRTCGNCLRARVWGLRDLPEAHCAAGHGEVMPLAWLVEEEPSSFRNPRHCPDFEPAEDL